MPYPMINTDKVGAQAATMSPAAPIKPAKY